MGGIAASTWLYCTSAFLFTAAFLVLFRTIAKSIGLLDHPNERKQHQGAIPLIGGPAMLIGMIPAMFAITGFTPYSIALAGAGGILIATGVVDDYKDLRPRTKLVIQLFAAFLATYFGQTYLHSLGEILGPSTPQLGALSLPITLIGIVGVINAVNMSDGVDGLGGGLAIISCVGLGILAAIHGSADGIQLPLLLASVVLAFLMFNFPLPSGKRASVFMGDSGSMFLGLVLATFFIRFSQGAHPVVRPSTCLWLFAHPLFDTVGVMLWRTLKGRSPLSAGREHLHHIVQHAGFKSHQCTYIILAVSTIFATIGIVFELAHVQEATVFGLFLCAFLGHFWVLKRAWKVTKFIKGALDPNGQSKTEAALDIHQPKPM